jgi:hypothetical protein
MSQVHLLAEESCPVCARLLPLSPPRWIGDSEPCPVCRQPLLESAALSLTAAPQPVLAVVA